MKQEFTEPSGSDRVPKLNLHFRPSASAATVYLYENWKPG